jgi:hypothetical protein
VNERHPLEGAALIVWSILLGVAYGVVRLIQRARRA